MINSRLKELKEKYLTERGFRKAKGWAIDSELNPEDYEEIFYEGDSLEQALSDFARKVEEYWIYNPSNGEQIFEDIDDALEYAEEISDVSFEKYVEVNK